MTNFTAQTLQPAAPELPAPTPTEFPLDPTNPLAWILVLTFFLGNTDEVLNAIANLIQTVASCGRGQNKKSDGSDRND